jgi:hypothetical protein
MGNKYTLTKTKLEEKTGHHLMDGSTSGAEAKYKEALDQSADLISYIFRFL